MKRDGAAVLLSFTWSSPSRQDHDSESWNHFAANCFQLSAFLFLSRLHPCKFEKFTCLVKRLFHLSTPDTQRPTHPSQFSAALSSSKRQQHREYSRKKIDSRSLVWCEGFQIQLAPDRVSGFPCFTSAARTCLTAAVNLRVCVLFPLIFSLLITELIKLQTQVIIVFTSRRAFRKYFCYCLLNTFT